MSIPQQRVPIMSCVPLRGNGRKQAQVMSSEYFGKTISETKMSQMYSVFAKSCPLQTLSIIHIHQVQFSSKRFPLVLG